MLEPRQVCCANWGTFFWSASSSRRFRTLIWLRWNAVQALTKSLLTSYALLFFVSWTSHCRPFSFPVFWKIERTLKHFSFSITQRGWWVWALRFVHAAIAEWYGGEDAFTEYVRGPLQKELMTTQPVGIPISYCMILVAPFLSVAHPLFYSPCSRAVGDICWDESSMDMKGHNTFQYVT